MKLVDEFRDRSLVKNLSEKIHFISMHNWNIMEICGGQTHSILKFNLTSFLPSKINLIHGPGCPVCVTPLELIDKAIAVALHKDVIFCSFGDMLRVPGSKHDLLSVKAKGGDVRMVYSPIDAVKIAGSNPNKKVVFFAIGFETTAPANAMAVRSAYQKGIKNFSILCSQVLVPPAIEALLSSEENNINAILAAGHVCTVMGFHQYIPIAKKYKVPIVVTGFEPTDILHGIYLAVKQLENNAYEIENPYSRVVSEKGNIKAQKLVNDVFETTDRNWRGIGPIKQSGLRLKKKYEMFDAEKIFDVGKLFTEESMICIAGDILKGLKRPNDCSAFSKECTPEHPIGAPMVSSEGACAAYFHYRKAERMYD